MIDILNSCFPGKPVSGVTKEHSDRFKLCIQNNESEVDLTILAKKTCPCDDYYEDILTVFRSNDRYNEGKLNIQEYLDAMTVLRENLSIDFPSNELKLLVI